VAVSLCGCHLLGGGLFVSLVPHPVEALTVELVEPDAVGLVRDQEVEDGPDERQAAGLAGKRPITLVRRLTSPSDRSSKPGGVALVPLETSILGRGPSE
jgi:hypothetical protein